MWNIKSDNGVTDFAVGLNIVSRIFSNFIADTLYTLIIKDFFDLNAEQPEELHMLVDNIKRLNEQQLESISLIIKDLANNK